jgi:hypothetical protein
MIDTRQTTEEAFKSFSFIKVFFLKPVYDAIPSWGCLDWLHTAIDRIFKVDKQDFRLAKQVERKLNRS